jgi:hypothetical protein
MRTYRRDVAAKAAPAVLAKLGKYQTGKGCLYVKSLADIHEPALRELLKAAAR